MLFVDTSALVKRYSKEVGTAVVDELIEDTDEPILITSLTVIEMTSASRRKFNRGELTERQRDDLLIAFFEEATERYTLIPIEAPVFELAFDLVLEDDLRTLDALQLGAALDAAGIHPDLTFACSDRDLAAVADDRGLGIFIPDE